MTARVHYTSLAGKFVQRSAVELPDGLGAGDRVGLPSDLLEAKNADDKVQHLLMVFDVEVLEVEPPSDTEKFPLYTIRQLTEPHVQYA